MWRLVPVVFLLSGCAPGVRAPGAQPLYATPAGGVLVLARDLVIPAGSARVYLQGGGVRAADDVDPWYPYCFFLSRVVGETDQTLRADRFEIVRVRHGEVEAAVVPATGGFVRVGGAPDGGGPAYLFATLLDLSSPRQPQVMHLECSVKSDYAFGHHVDLDEFARLAGPLLRIESPGRA